ncbi:adenosine receptor A2a-like [Lytechinus variegatus]|uniref:adenosine receptor A2a-like n=1 Tax=Lytechinus variegatus TaxID=7654 RepID=UPI001BB0EEC3|nr:adenosine receptor A2a-like [Lytechinus variegatus]
MASTYVIVTIATNFTISIVGTIGNVLLILAFIKCRDLRTISNVFNLTTFVAGLSVCAITYPLQGLLDAFVIRQNPGCLLVLCVAFFTGFFFTLNVLALTIERYISICHSLHAPTILTKRRVAIALGGILVYAAFFGLILPLATPISNKEKVDPAVGCRMFVIVHKSYVTFLFTTFIFPALPMLLIYTRIFMVLRRHIRAVVDQSTVRPTGQADQIEPNARPALRERERRERARRKREVKSAVFLFILIFSFTICVLPFAIFILTTTFTLNILISPLAFSLSHALVYSVCAINPYLYGFGNKAFRQGVLSLFRNGRKSSDAPTISTISTSKK